MAIVSTDIVLYLTVTTGAAGDTTAQADPNASLGKYKSTTVLGTGANALFSDLTGAQNAASQVDYRAVAVLNNHATLTLQNAVVYLSAEVAGGANCALAVDTTAASAKGASVAQGDVIANATTAPTLVGAFSSPTTAGTGLALGNIAPGQVKFVWVRRTATNSAATADGLTLGISGDTGP